MANTVLVVDDDPDIRNLVVDIVGRMGWRATLVETAAEALESLRSRPPDLILLDLGLPDADGLDVLRDVMQSLHTPVVVLTARGDEYDRVLGLELGASDYVVKPFSPRELAARMRAVLRRNDQIPTGAVVEENGIRVDTVSRRVWADETEIDLTAREFDLLAYLTASPGRAFTRDQLLDAVWGSSTDWQNPKTVDEHVYRLRRKLKTEEEGRGVITTVRGIGYRFETASA